MSRADEPQAEPTIAYVAVPGPWGPVHVAASETGLVALDVLAPPAAFEASVTRRWRTVPRPLDGATPRTVRRLLEMAASQLAGYFEGRPGGLATLPLDLRVGTAWDRRVLEGVRQIPYGRVTSYGRLARIVGSPGAARAAGGAVGRNPIGLAIPCHRVIAADGSLGGYGGDWWGGRERLLAIKRELLAREGVVLPATGLLG
jgi:methylated-DNA-[protein]-cysteine S-methyltransferase